MPLVPSLNEMKKKPNLNLFHLPTFVIRALSPSDHVEQVKNLFHLQDKLNQMKKVNNIIAAFVLGSIALQPCAKFSFFPGQINCWCKKTRTGLSPSRSFVKTLSAKLDFFLHLPRVYKIFLSDIFQFTFTNTEWLEASFQKRECVNIVPSSRDSNR